MSIDSTVDQNDPDYDYNQCVNNLYDPYPHKLNYISNYLDDYFPWMDDYRPKHDDEISDNDDDQEVKDRFFFPRAPTDRPYSHTGKVNRVTL